MGATILVADDDPAILAVCQDLFEMEGYTDLIAPTGLAAVEQAGRWLPVLALLDMQMPGLDGIQVCRTLRQTGRTTGIRLVLMSAAPNLARRSPDLACADAFIAKPFDLDHVLRTVAHLLAG